MRKVRITPNALCSAHEQLSNLSKEFREVVCQKTQWREYGYRYRIRRNSHLKRHETEEINEIKKAILTQALESCK